MPIPCTICTHDQHHEIDHDLVGGGTVRDVAGRFGVAKSSVDRHKRRCLAPRVANALARSEELSAERLIAFTHGLLDRASVGMVVAQRNEDDYAHRAWFREARKTVETLAKLGGIGRPDTEVHVDARSQTALVNLSDDELRALVAAARETQRQLAAAPVAT
jgi:hypothetical protein